MNNILMIAMTYGFLYVIGFLFGKMSNKNIVFGVTIQDEHLQDDRLKKLSTLYIKLYSSIIGGLAVVFIYLELKSYNPWYFMTFTLLWLIIAFTLFADMHKKTKAIKKELMVEYPKTPSLMSASTRDRKVEMPMIKMHFSLAWLIPIITGLVTFINYDAIDSKIPMHYDVTGKITSFADKSLGAVYFMVIMQIFMTLILYGSTYVSIKFSKRKLNPKQPKTSEIQYKMAMRRFSMMMAAMAAIMNITFLLIQITIIGLYEFDQVLSILVTVIPLVSIMFLMGWFFVSTGMSGERIKIDIGETLLDVGISDKEDDYWKWGMFYVNKNDSSLFVPKRFGGGFTLNFGNPFAILIFLGLLIFIGLSIGLPMLFV